MGYAQDVWNKTKKGAKKAEKAVAKTAKKTGVTKSGLTNAAKRTSTDFGDFAEGMAGDLLGKGIDDQFKRLVDKLGISGLDDWWKNLDDQLKQLINEGPENIIDDAIEDLLPGAGQPSDPPSGQPSSTTDLKYLSDFLLRRGRRALMLTGGVNTGSNKTTLTGA